MGTDGFEYGGPIVEDSIRGVVDDIATKMTERGGKEREVIHLYLVDGAVGLSDGTNREFETREVIMAANGRPGQTFYNSARRILDLPKKDEAGKPVRLNKAMFVGNEITLSVTREDFTTPDGTRAEMRLFTVESLKAPEVQDVTDEEVLGAINGKTPSEVLEMRGGYRGTKFVQVLGSRRGILAHFGERVKEEDGVYRVV